MPYGTVNADVIGTSVSGSNLGAGNASIMKNRIINGAMMIDQRNAGASVTLGSGATYSVDRFRFDCSQASKISAQQNAGSVTPPNGFTNYLGVTSLASTSLGASDYFVIQQSIEGYNMADLNWGSANASTITVSFWVRSSLTGTFGGSLRNNADDRSYPFTYTINAANTWEQKTVTITGSTSGTWLTTNVRGMYVCFSLGTGSTFNGTAGSWSSSLLLSATGATSVVGTNGATFYITGVQLEVGSSATGFEYRQYGQELALCQRYYWKNVATAVENAGLAVGFQVSTTVAMIQANYPVSMRSKPTATTSNTIISDNALYDADVSSIGSVVSTLNTAYVSLNTASAGAQFRPCMFRAKSSGSAGYIDFSAEL